MSKHQFIKSIILNFEKNYSVDQWSINGVDIWPNIRFKLYFYLLNHLQEDCEAVPRILKPVPKPLKKGLISTRWKQVKGIVKYYIFVSSIKEVDYIFMGLKMHRVLFKGKWFNRFFDPIIERYRGTYDFLHLEIDQMTNTVKHPSISYSIPSLLQPFSIVSALKSKLGNGNREKSELHLIGFEKFIEEITTEKWYSQELTMSYEYWENWAQKVKSKKAFFLKLFSKSQLKGLIIASYYGYENTAAAILAAKQLNIPVADFQHGPQTNVHMAYSFWSKIPSMGYNTMPSYYWCWDDKSSCNINCWNSGERAKALGNTWLQYTFSNKLSKSPKYITYSLQVLNANNLDYFFPKSILKLIETTTIEWKIRMHPRSQLSIGDLNSFLQSHKIDSSISFGRAT